MTDWDDIRYFLAVARSGTVSGASKTLGVNHTTVTRRIQGLEKRHGVKLFNRQRDGYEMTDAALLILDRASSMEANSFEISRTLLGQDTRLEGKVNLTMPHDIFECCLADSIAAFRAEHPGIEVNLMVTKGLKNLANQEADIAIRLTPNPPDYLVGQKVVDLHHAIYAPERLDLKSPGLVLWEGQDIPDWALDNFDAPFIAMTVDDLTSMYAAVKAGIGLARMPCYMPDSLKEKEVKKLPISLPPSDWSVWVLNHVDLRKTTRIQVCKAFLVEALNDKKSIFEGT